MRTEKEVQKMLDKVHNSAFHVRARNKDQRIKKDLLYAIMQTLAWMKNTETDVNQRFENRINELSGDK